MPVPWRSAPVTVQSSEPSRRFEIDASSERTRTDSTLENFRRGGFRVSGTRTATTDRATSRYDYHEPHEIIFEEYEDDDDDSDLDLAGLNLDNEREQLISGDEDRDNDLDLNEVMLISRSEIGDNFTINSETSTQRHIPPSPARPRSDSPVQPIPPPPRTPVRERPHKRAHRTPPPPTYPAPLPPASPFNLRKPSIDSITPGQSSAAASSSNNLPRRNLPLPTPPNSSRPSPAAPLPPTLRPAFMYLAGTNSSSSLPLAQTRPPAPSHPPFVRPGYGITGAGASADDLPAILPRVELGPSPPAPAVPPRPPLEYALAHTRNQSQSYGIHLQLFPIHVIPTIPFVASTRGDPYRKIRFTTSPAF
ncbi:hypothetical protein BT96DRAFT_181864 [Gymnopus androsaceus JB14]|uniref:Uncharacterized protein n=1 Tax=Gymnopus androsaceus JB14 TaxID=1447944 RepID=A0A6A4HC71_9AGAR|nr:hypothetical protein BT96DRAFT_181864 [Gymnopus androsaceus JB14]